ncbi:hypothetical protein HHI36_012076 [Cryptolaemus montrouzieri]|uniref:Angiotensin-converting enzyme n=1 Tax=Cryptolaemus montrouzieri TaxID=559131 RepID=A0ABD2NDH5_9CUCU
MLNMLRSLLLLVVFCFLTCSCSDPEIEEEEINARAFMDILNAETGEDINLLSNLEWDYATNLTDANLKRKTQFAADMSVRVKVRWEEVMKYNWKAFSDPTLKRQFMLYSLLGDAALSKDEIVSLHRIIGDMSKIYSTAKICDYSDKTQCNLSLEPDIVEIHANSRDEAELKHVWVSWRDAVGPHIRNMYRDYVHLLNKTAHLNHFKSADELWLFEYEEFNMKSLKGQIRTLWEQVKPLYQQLHAYVRHGLRKRYGSIVSENGPIPAHLLGNVWSQSWANLADDFKPFPNAAEQDITKNLKKQNYTVEKIFRTAEDFFTSIGLPKMVDLFWKKSIFTKPSDRNIICHASAWEFQDGEDFRIKMCTKVTEENFNTVHHEMGHIEYYMLFKDLPLPFRRGANPGFHEAVGDLVSLSVKSPKHLKKLNLFDARLDDPELMLNNLFEIGMTKLPLLPFSYMVDQWRWGVFSGKIPFDDYNCKWWELRQELQGLEPPVPRSEADFDPGSKYHIPSSTPYVRYFVAIILQFQFHRAACEKAGQYDRNNPHKLLHLCDIYQNKAAGTAIRQMLSLGASKPWPEALYTMTGQHVMDASALLEYFRPLQTWLEKKNRENNVHVGWEKSTKTCTKGK